MFQLPPLVLIRYILSVKFGRPLTIYLQKMCISLIKESYPYVRFILIGLNVCFEETDLH